MSELQVICVCSDVDPFIVLRLYRFLLLHCHLWYFALESLAELTEEVTGTSGECFEKSVGEDASIKSVRVCVPTVRIRIYPEMSFG